MRGSKHLEGQSHRFCGCSFEGRAPQRTGRGWIVFVVVVAAAAAAVAPRRINQTEDV